MKSISYPDLGSTVTLGGVPDHLAAELPTLYSSCFSVMEYFRAFDHATDMSVCELADPRQVVVFAIEGRTVEILNKVFDIDRQSAERICHSIFRALPKTRRIHIEVKFPPRDIRLPKRVLYSSDDMVVDLPQTEEEYLSGLGRNTRRNIRYYGRRLADVHPDTTLQVLHGDDIDDGVMGELARLNVARMERRGIDSVLITDDKWLPQLHELAGPYGTVLRHQIGGSTAAVRLIYSVGADAWVFFSGFDPAYEEYRLGLLSFYESIVYAIGKGARRAHYLMGGAVEHKARMGAKPATAWRVSVFRSHADHLVFAREGLWLLRLRVSRAEPYWALRHAARRTLLGVARRLGITTRWTRT